MAKKETTNKNKENENQSKKPKVVFYWLKKRSYVAENVQWNAGFYRVKGEIPRLEGQSKKYVEKFGEDIEEARVHKIANHFLINTEGEKGKLRNAEDIIEEMSIDVDVPKDQPAK